jgi:hypothetical protein
MQTTSSPPKAVLNTVCPRYWNPASAASCSSFCIVDVLDVARSRYPNLLALVPEARDITTTTSLPPKAVSPPITVSKRNPISAASFSSFCIVDVLLVATTW